MPLRSIHVVRNGKIFFFYGSIFILFIWAIKKKILPFLEVTQSCPTLCNPMDYTVHGILQARINGVGSHSLLQGIFPTQGSNPGLLYCRRILYQLSHKGSLYIYMYVRMYVYYTILYLSVHSLGTFRLLPCHSCCKWWCSDPHFFFFPLFLPYSREYTPCHFLQSSVSSTCWSSSPFSVILFWITE